MSKASQSAYGAIRGRILSGEFPAGTHLKEEHLAEVCGVSRTPIRDALRALAAEDYVRVVPNRGTFVSKFSDDDIEDIFILRSKLEGYAARLAARRATPDQICGLREQCKKIGASMQTGGEPDREAFLAANRRFHEIITEAAGSERLSQMIARLIEQPIIAQTAQSYKEPHINRSNRQHMELVDAIESGDGNWAEAIMSGHILAGYQTFKQNLVPAGDRSEEDGAPARLATDPSKARRQPLRVVSGSKPAPRRK